MDMSNDKCPKGHATVELLSTLNEWKFYCKTCGERFNERGEFLREPQR